MTTHTYELTFRPERLLCESPGCYKPVVEAWEDTGRYCPDCSVQNDLLDRQGRWERLATYNRLAQLHSAFAQIV